MQTKWETNIRGKIRIEGATKTGKERIHTVLSV